MSALPPKADIDWARGDVRFVPKADIKPIDRDVGWAISRQSAKIPAASWWRDVEEGPACFIVRDCTGASASLCLLRGTISGQAAHKGRGAADRGQYSQTAGITATPAELGNFVRTLLGSVRPPIVSP
jgi:hypothetical protein